MKVLLVKEIGDYFRRSPVAIGEGIRKVEGLQRKYTSLEEALKWMGENVVRGGKENTVFPLPDTDFFTDFLIEYEPVPNLILQTRRLCEA